MSRQSLDKKSSEKLGFEFLDDYSSKDPFLWDSNSSNEEPIFNSKSEILWSREKNDIISQNDFFRGLQDGFSDLTEGSTSSCSWHNDDFDMNSSNKVKASLEAIEDALYEQQKSSLINKSVFQECCDWSNKFPYFRLKGTQVFKPQEDSTLYLSSQKNFNDVSESSTSSLQVEGKKMAIHAPLKKTLFDKTANDLNEAQNYFEETLVDDGNYEEFVLDTSRDTCNKVLHSQYFEEESSNIASAKLIEDKVIEKVALKMWPKVLEILQKLDDTHIHDTNDDFQLPPIVSAVGQKHVTGRPRTEGTDAYTSDFPRLDSLLSISPKVLQSKREYGSWRATQKSRPNSEIQLHRRNHSVPSIKGMQEQTKLSSFSSFSQQISSNQTLFSSSKLTIPEKDESISLFLPAVNEDSLEPPNILDDFYLSPELKKVTSVALDTSPKKSECFLPPIDTKYYMPSNAKLTRNLFTFFGPQLKPEIHHSNRPATRPNTSASRKALKYSGSLKHKLSNDGHSSLSHSNAAETKKLSEVNLEKPVTLFPIVTSLVPHKERNSSSGKKGLLNTFGGGRKR